MSSRSMCQEAAPPLDLTHMTTTSDSKGPTTVPEVKKSGNRGFLGEATTAAKKTKTNITLGTERPAGVTKVFGGLIS